jgi:hypothetical protein
LVQTFCQPLFSNSTLAIHKSFPHPKSKKSFPFKKPKSKAKAKSKSLPYPKKPKAWSPPSVSLFYPVVNRVEKFSGRCDIVNRRNLHSCFSEYKQLRRSSFFSLFCSCGCAYLSL